MLGAVPLQELQPGGKREEAGVWKIQRCSNQSGRAADTVIKHHNRRQVHIHKLGEASGSGGDTGPFAAQTNMAGQPHIVILRDVDTQQRSDCSLRLGRRGLNARS